MVSTILTGFVISGVGASFARADEVTVGASKDNTLFEHSSGTLSNGAGPYLFVGRTDFRAAGALRRGVIAFDVAGNVPDGSIIDAVTLRLNLSLSAPSAAQPINLHRALNDWGEGTSNSGSLGGGAGSPSTANDATWKHTFYDTGLWNNLGGDFDPAVSASQIVDALGAYTFGSAPAMVADAQAWLNDPAQNFGWLLTGNEAALGTAQRFDSRENTTAANPPALTVSYTPATPRDANLDGVVDIDDLTDLADNYGVTSDARWVKGNFDGDGDVDLVDLTLLATYYVSGQSQAMADFQSLAAVPEPASLWLASLLIPIPFRRARRGSR
jgi:hypothetical protein